jgi:hypothetical protein
MDEQPIQRRDELLQLLSEVETESTLIESLGKQLVQSARESRDIAAPMKKIVRSLPDDAFLPSESLHQLTGGLRDLRDLASQVGDSFTICNSYSAACSGVTNTTNSTVVYLDVYRSSPHFMEAKNQILTIQEKGPQLQRAKQSMQRLGLDSRLLDEAQGAIDRPVAGDGGPVLVLIALRECVNSVLAELLPRRPKQEPAKGYDGKVNSIGNQCARPRLKPDHFQRLATSAEALMNELSGTKQAELSREEQREFFIRGLTWLNAFMSSIDESRLKPLVP